MTLKKLAFAVAIICGCYVGYLWVDYSGKMNDLHEVEVAAYAVERGTGYFGDDKKQELFDVLGIELVAEEEGFFKEKYVRDDGFLIKKPAFNSGNVDREKLAVLVEAYNADPVNTTQVSAEDVLMSLQGDYYDQLLACDTSYTPANQPYPFINWCMLDADVVYASGHSVEGRDSLGARVYVPGDAVDWYMKPVSNSALTNFDYVIHGDELFSVDTAFRWEYEANQKEN